MTLYINACVREESRTKRLAEHLLGLLGGPVTELCPAELALPVVNADFLRERDALIAAQDFDHPLFALARQFAAADQIVIAAPFWDLSFPAALKQYLEQVNVVGIAFRYSPEGVPISLCSAKKLWYVTTAGGFFIPEEFGFGYVKSLAQNYYGIQDVELVQTGGLDIDGADVESIMRKGMDKLTARFEINR